MGTVLVYSILINGDCWCWKFTLSSMQSGSSPSLRRFRENSVSRREPSPLRAQLECFTSSTGTTYIYLHAAVGFCFIHRNDYDKRPMTDLLCIACTQACFAPNQVIRYSHYTILLFYWYSLRKPTLLFLLWYSYFWNVPSLYHSKWRVSLELEKLVSVHSYSY